MASARIAKNLVASSTAMDNGAESVWAFTMKLSGEPLTFGRILAAALIVAGLSLMKLSTSD